MDMNEKLVELLNNSFAEQYEKRGLLTAPHTATDLIAHGVTVQEWISAKDRLPEKDVPVLGMYQRNPFAAFEPTVVEWVGNGWVNTNNDQYGTVTHWMPLPQPPKGE